MWEATAAHGLEGVVAKRTASRYQPGRRSRDWVKVKHWQTASLPIVGYLSRRERIAAVLVAAPRPDGSLHLAGTVEWDLAAGWRAGLADALAALTTPGCPLQPAGSARCGCDPPNGGSAT